MKTPWGAGPDKKTLADKLAELEAMGPLDIYLLDEPLGKCEAGGEPLMFFWRDEFPRLYDWLLDDSCLATLETQGVRAALWVKAPSWAGWKLPDAP